MDLTGGFPLWWEQWNLVWGIRSEMAAEMTAWCVGVSKWCRWLPMGDLWLTMVGSVLISKVVLNLTTVCLEHARFILRYWCYQSFSVSIPTTRSITLVLKRYVCSNNVTIRKTWWRTTDHQSFIQTPVRSQFKVIGESQLRTCMCIPIVFQTSCENNLSSEELIRLFELVAILGGVQRKQRFHTRQ